MATDTTVNNLIINKLTQAQYNALESPSDTELYLVPDEIDTTPTSGSTNPVTSGGVYSVIEPLAPKASPALTGTPTAPTAAAGTNTTQIATTAFVQTAVDSKNYVANLQSGDEANYITEPEVKSVKVNGSSTNSASTNNCVLQYDTTNKCLKFIFN